MSGLQASNVLITGGSGTLGHAIVRTAEKEGWDCSITIYSRSELRQAQMRARHPKCRYVLGDVRDLNALYSAIVGHDLVIHAAAMKRIPECEAYPAECYDTNVIGSINVVRACQAAGVKRCVGISTDKACRSITAYGASKLAMEKLFQAQPERPTIFTLVRYGNVVASNGSVIPLWRAQAKQDGVVTITNPAMTRFWMAPSDAVALVVKAAQDVAGLLRVPKMSALSITDMAEIIAPRAKQRIVGVRSAEKEHEDLVASDETASDIAGYYLLSGCGGSTGYTYTSDTAPRLSREAFLSMLDEAESYE